MLHLSALRSAVSANMRVLFQRQNNEEELVGISQNMQRYKRSFRFFNRATKKCQSLVKGPSYWKSTQTPEKTKQNAAFCFINW